MIFWVSKGIREFSTAMVTNPHDWVQGPYEFVNVKKPDIRIWTANGVFFVSISGNRGLSLFEKFWILSAINLTTARRLNTPEPTERKETSHD